MTETTHPQPAQLPRFDSNTQIYGLGLLLLFVGLLIQYGVGIALLVTGAVLICVSIATSFFITWLASKDK